MKPIKIISTQDPGTLHIRFLPTDICNFDCSYCFPNQKDGKYRYPKNVQTVIKNFRLLFDMYAKKLNKNRFHLLLSGGGEPTVWPHIEEFCQGIKETHNVYTTVISNGSRSVRWWKENSKYFDEAVLSYHHEFVDTDHYIEVADTLYEAGVNVTSLVLMNAKGWDQCIQGIERLKTSKHAWFIQAMPVVTAPGMDIESYTQEQLEFCNQCIKRLPSSEWLLENFHKLKVFESVALFEDNSTLTARPETYVVNKWNFFKGWTCNVALETLLVLSDGTVKGSCHEEVFNGKIFNVFSETFENEFNNNVEFRPIICPRNCCSCQPETHVTKYVS